MIKFKLEDQELYFGYMHYLDTIILSFYDKILSPHRIVKGFIPLNLVQGGSGEIVKSLQRIIEGISIIT